MEIGSVLGLAPAPDPERKRSQEEIALMLTLIRQNQIPDKKPCKSRCNARGCEGQSNQSIERRNWKTLERSKNTTRQTHILSIAKIEFGKVARILRHFAGEARSYLREMLPNPS